MWRLLKSDMDRKRAHYVRIDNFVNKYLKITFQLGTIYLWSYRMGQSVTKMSLPARILLYPIYLPLEFMLSTLTGIRIRKESDIGSGLVVHNFSGIFVDAKHIGEDCTLNQCVTIGPDHRRNGRPVLGNNVFVGSGAKILGDITIGDNVVVASNAAVVDSVPANCTVVGVPARIVARNQTSDYLKFKNTAN